MKIRTDFVSNSSSSSFVIFGDSFKIDDIIKKSKTNDYIREYYDNIYGKLDKKEINCEFDECNNVVYIGMSPDKMKDDETLSNFKKRVEKKIIGIFKKLEGKINIHFITGISQDGMFQED